MEWTMIAIVPAALLAVAGATAGPPPAAVCGTIRPATTEPSPATIATARGVEAFLDAAKTLDDAAFVAAIKDHGPVMPGGPEVWLRLRGVLRGLDYCGVKSATAARVDLWMFDSNYDSFAFSGFTPAAAPSDKIAFVDVKLAGAETPPGVVRTQLQPPALVAAIQARAADMAARDQFSGALLVAQRGRLLFQQAYGLADREARVPNRLDTEFRFGSMGKMFTMVAILQLVQDGKIDLQAPIGRYLPAYPNQDVATKVTVANLLSHTGGTGDIFGPDYVTHRTTLRDLKDYVDLYGKRGPEFTPGTRFAYSNYGFILLGRIVEEVSGLGYDAYLQKNIFTPAGMTSTSNVAESTIMPRRAVAYMGSGAQLKRADETLPFRGTSAGGGFSTVGDFQKFADGLTSHRVLRADTLQALMDGSVKGPDGHVFPFDFGGTLPGSGRFIGHGGGAPGMNGQLFHFLDSGYTIVVLANRDPNAAGSIAMFAAHRLPMK
jgi:D-alanyl-D-alanine carboxypeptidase